MVRKKQERTTYDVRLLCRNCEKEWMEEIDKGIYVRCEKDNNYMVTKDKPSKKLKNFTCPKCGAHTKIARRPLVQKR